jgi:CheY-like chemotaxis protein
MAFRWNLDELTERLEAPSEAAQPAGILVADDDPDVRAFLMMSLKQHGFNVWLAATSYEALALYRSHGESIAVVLLDVDLPGLDGPHTLKALYVQNPEVRCCFTGGDLGPYTREQLRQTGAVAVFTKPFQMAKLVAELRRLANLTGTDLAHPTTA